MEHCPESCIWKVKYLCINGTWNTKLIHGFTLDNARLLKAFGTAFYAIITLNSIKHMDIDSKGLIFCPACAFSPTLPYIVKRHPNKPWLMLTPFYFLQMERLTSLRSVDTETAASGAELLPPHLKENKYSFIGSDTSVLIPFFPSQ